MNVYQFYQTVKCKSCHELVKYNDYVYMDILNAIIHRKCYFMGAELDSPIKDSGKLKELINTYDFLQN